jgi:hypothetical protein
VLMKSSANLPSLRRHMTSSALQLCSWGKNRGASTPVLKRRSKWFKLDINSPAGFSDNKWNGLLVYHCTGVSGSEPDHKSEFRCFTFM